MSIQSEIDRIKAGKADAKAALIERGVDPGEAPIDEYGNKIRAIPTGVTSFKGRTGAVEPQVGDYTAQMVGADPAGSAASALSDAKAYADGLTAADVGALPISGGTLTGQLNCGGRLLRGVANPTTGQDAVNLQYAQANFAPNTHNHGVIPISQGGTGVSSMVGTDYTTNRPRGIVLQSSTPSSVPNGCIVGVYE